jgi:hypothetical protein
LGGLFCATVVANVADEEERIQEGKLKVMHLPEKPKQVEAKFRVR